jgi:hypothetical protein
MKPIFIFAAAVMLTIILSGCIFPAAITSNYGVVFEDLVAEPSQLQSDEPFMIKARIRNTGPVTSTDIIMRIFNVGADQYSDITCTPSSASIANCESGFILIGEDEERGLPGESRTCTWDCKAPSLEKGSSVVYNPSVRLYYLYTTTTITSVMVASQDELLRLQASGSSFTPQATTTTKGPISVDIRLKGPLKFWENDNQVEFPIEIEVQNTGDGFACALHDTLGGFDGCDNSENWNKVIILSNSLDIMFKDCDLQQGKALVNMWNQRGKINCEAVMNIPPDVVNMQKDIKIEAVYDYLVDKSLSISVKGTKEFKVT